MPVRDHDEAMAEYYVEHPEDALAVMNNLLEDGEPAELLIILRQMTKAFGGVPAVAEQAKLNATQLYRTLSAEGNPTLSSLMAVLKAMGLQLAVTKVRKSEKSAKLKRKAA